MTFLQSRLCVPIFWFVYLMYIEILNWIAGFQNLVSRYLDKYKIYVVWNTISHIVLNYKSFFKRHIKCHISISVQIESKTNWSFFRRIYNYWPCKNQFSGCELLLSYLMRFLSLILLLRMLYNFSTIFNKIKLNIFPISPKHRHFLIYVRNRSKNNSDQNWPFV